MAGLSRVRPEGNPAVKDGNVLHRSPKVYTLLGYRQYIQGLAARTLARAMRPSRATRSATPATAESPRPSVPASGRSGASATQRIVDSITLAIVERRLMPGTKLSEQKIADIFKVSRTLVRQALNQLCRDQLVVLEPARGAFVATPTVEEARQLFEVRKILETALTRALVPVITERQIAQLRRHLQDEADAIQATDVSGRTRLLADFHLVLAQMLGNEVLTRMLQELLVRSSLIALMYQSSHSAEASMAEHVAIVDAFERRDLKAAVRLTVDHLEHVERNLRLDPQATDLSDILKVKT